MEGDGMMDNILQGDEFDMDLELFEMRKQFNEMKRERMSSQKNVDIMENKIKLLESEEITVKKTLNRQIHNKNQMVKKMAELGAAKEEIIKAKMEQQKEINMRAQKMAAMKDQIQYTLKNYHQNVAARNAEEAQKQKAIKKEIMELKQEQMEDILKKNKQTQKIVREQVKGFSEKKKQEDLKRKQKLKEELAMKMREEMKLKEELEEKLNVCEKREGELIEKISQTKQGILNVKIDK